MDKSPGIAVILWMWQAIFAWSENVEQNQLCDLCKWPTCSWLYGPNWSDQGTSKEECAAVHQGTLSKQDGSNLLNTKTNYNIEFQIHDGRGDGDIWDNLFGRSSIYGIPTLSKDKWFDLWHTIYNLWWS